MQETAPKIETIRILFVDDDENILPIIERLFHKESPEFSIDYAGTGLRGLQKIEDHDYGCIIADYMMMEMNGLDLLVNLKNRGSDIPFILITARGDENIAAESLRCGASDYFTKEELFAHFPRMVNSIHRSIERRRQEIERKQAEEELKKSQEQLRNLSFHLQSIREEERTRIAQEIHDELGQTLTALQFDLLWLSKKLPENQKPMFDKIKSMTSILDKTIETIQRISSDLRPVILDDLGLISAIEWQVEQWQRRTGIESKIIFIPDKITVEDSLATPLFRILQETLTNAARHSKATMIKVRLKKKANYLELKVQDNGIGITKEQISDSKSFGLIGIRERVYFLDGKLEINGNADKGTTIKVSIPLRIGEGSLEGNTYRR